MTLDPTIQKALDDLPEQSERGIDPVELVIYRIARIALLEAHFAACSARRSVGQLLRTDR